MARDSNEKPHIKRSLARPGEWVCRMLNPWSPCGFGLTPKQAYLSWASRAVGAAVHRCLHFPT
jgi:hypothetical protein